MKKNAPGAAALREAYHSGTFIPSSQDGELSAEGLICAAQHAVDEYHKVEHGSGSGMYSPPMLVVATFSDALIYEYEGKLYRIGYVLDGTEVMLDDDPEEVIAEFVPADGEMAESTQGLAEVISKDGDTWILHSKDRSKVLGKFKSRKGAERRERQVQAFKHMKEEGEPDAVSINDVLVDLTAIRQGKVKLEFVPDLLQEATGAQGNIDALVRWAGGQGFRGCVKHLTGKEGISDIPRLCGWLKARAREGGYLKESHEIQEGVLLREARPTGVLREAKLNKTDRVIENTVIITAESANGPHGKRRYTDAALKQIAQMAEGLPAYVNHVGKDQAFQPRDIKDLIGRHRNVRYDPGQHRVVSNLHVLEHQSPWVFSLAEELPDVVGNSLVSRGMTRMDGDTEIVEEVVALRSVDLVSDPGATKGLFEHREAWRHRAAPAPTPQGGDDMELKEVQEYLKKADDAVRGVLMEALAGPQLKERDARIKELTEANSALITKGTEQGRTLTEAQAKVSGFEAAEAQRQKAGRLEKALTESDLGKKYKASPLAISEEFRGILIKVDEAEWTKLIEDRVKMLDAATQTGPRSNGKTLQEGTLPEDAHAQLLRAL